MIYREFSASPGLAGIVDRLWFLEGTAEEIAADPIPPDGHTEIIVHAGEPFLETRLTGTCVQDRVLIAGQATEAVHVRPRGLSRMVGARLRPDAGRRLFSLPPHELTNRIVRVDDVDRCLGRTLRDDVASRSSAEDMVRALDLALVRAAAGRPRHAPAAPAVSLALHRGGMVRVSDLAASSGVSPRQLERVFHDHVGLGPKLFLRIVRFQHVLRRVREGATPAGWAAVAAEHGFYDQSHFIRDFKAFAGTAPTGLEVSDASLAAVFSAIRRDPL